MILNGVMAVILRYFTEFGSFRGALHKSGFNWRTRWLYMYDDGVEKFTFAISSPDEFLYLVMSSAMTG